MRSNEYISANLSLEQLFEEAAHLMRDDRSRAKQAKIAISDNLPIIFGGVKAQSVHARYILSAYLAYGYTRDLGKIKLELDTIGPDETVNIVKTMIASTLLSDNNERLIGMIEHTIGRFSLPSREFLHE